MPSAFESHRTATGKFQSILINILLWKSTAVKPTGVLFVPRWGGAMERHYIRISVACEMFSAGTITFKQTPGFVARKERFGLLTACALIFMTSLLLSCGDIESNPGPSPDSRGDNTPLESRDDGPQDQHSGHSQSSSQLPQSLDQDVLTILKDTMKRMEANQVKHHHHHQPLNREGRWGTTYDFATSFLHFPCSPLPTGTCRTPGLSIPTSSFVRLVFFPLSLCLSRWFWPDLMNGKHDHTTAVCVFLRSSGDLHVVQLPAGSWHGLPRW